ncbi:MAG: hypothetical protein EOO90_17395 [Pedobacter sp.]|nr:MAG: hypothetical protein EOO90_17395 [Pedobacter sp.]
MGTIRNGGNGAFSGKAGSFIGSSWKNTNYIKGIPKLSKKPASLKQLEQRMRFGLALDFLTRVKDVVNIGFKTQAANRTTAMNVAIKYAVADAMTGTYPDVAIDPSLIKLSKGRLEKVGGVQIVQSTGLTINWFAHHGTAGKDDDKLYVVVYHPEDYMFYAFEAIAERVAGTVNLPLPSDYASATLHVYLFFKHRDTISVSDCTHVLVGG